MLLIGRKGVIGQKSSNGRRTRDEREKNERWMIKTGKKYGARIEPV